MCIATPRLEILDQWADGADRFVCVSPAPKYNPDASRAANRGGANPGVSALAAEDEYDDHEEPLEAAGLDGSSSSGRGTAAGSGPTRAERLAWSRQKRARQLHALKQGATCVAATVTTSRRIQ